MSNIEELKAELKVAGAKYVAAWIAADAARDLVWELEEKIAKLEKP